MENIIINALVFLHNINVLSALNYTNDKRHHNMIVNDVLGFITDFSICNIFAEFVLVYNAYLIHLGLCYINICFFHSAFLTCKGGNLGGRLVFTLFIRFYYISDDG